VTQLAETITETEWGLHVVLKEDVVIDNSNILPKMKYLIDRCKEAGKYRILIDASAMSPL
jgi:hypothetical protein